MVDPLRVAKKKAEIEECSRRIKLTQAAVQQAQEKLTAGMYAILTSVVTSSRVLECESTALSKRVQIS